MQNLDVKETIQKKRKTKFEIRKKREESIINGKSIENTGKSQQRYSK